MTMVPQNPELWPHFVKFAAAQVKSGDLDPMYLVLKEVYRGRRYDLDTALWHTFLYVAYYDIGSAERAFARYPFPQRVEPEKLRGLPTGIERRGFRGNDLAALHINSLLDIPGASRIGADWVKVAAAGVNAEEGWHLIQGRFQLLKYAGPWAGYKWADLLKNVHDFPITASGIGGGRSETAGPIPGMVLLTKLPWETCAFSGRAQRDLLKMSIDAGVPFTGLDQLETALCDFNSLVKGMYYVGKDIDEMMPSLRRAEASQEFWVARKEVFEPRYLGEVGGWDGVRPELKAVFKERREVLT
jgi:hypothetical protein